MAYNKENSLTIYIYIILLVWQAGMKIPFLNFLQGNMQIIIAVLLLLIGTYHFKNKKSLFSLRGDNVFKLICCSLILSVITAYFFGGQDFSTSILLYRHHIWLLFLPLFFRIRPSLKSISNSLYIFTITSIFVCLCQMNGIFSVNVVSTNIWGEEVEVSPNEFGGYGIVGDRTIVFALYLFLHELVYNYNWNNLLKVFVAFVAIILSTQRAMLLFALPFTLYVLLFRIQVSSSKKNLLFIIFSFASLLFFSYTIDIWQSFLLETTSDINNEDYNRRLSLDYFLFNHNNNIITTIFGNGFLSIKSMGGKFIYNLGFRGIYIDDIGMIGVWIRYGIIPIIVLLYILKRALFTKSMPLYMKLISLHIGLLPTAWTLIGPHYFVLIFLIYLYYFNINKPSCDSRVNN